MKSLSINVPLVEALDKMPRYTKFMRDVVTKKRSMNFETIEVIHQVSAIVHSMAPKLEDIGAFTILCTIGSAEFAKALYDIGASINLMLYLVFKTLGIGQPRPTSMRLQTTNCTMKRLLGAIEDVLVRVDKFILPTVFVILDCEVDYEVLIILGRPFLSKGKALCDVETGELTFCVSDKKAVFHEDSSYNSIEEPPTLELKQLPPHIRYEFLGLCSTLLVILSSCLTNVHVDSTLAVLQKRKKAIGWTMAHIWEDAIWFVQCTDDFSTVYNGYFTDMVEDYLEVFMDDLSMVEDSFDDYILIRTKCWLDVKRSTWYSIGRNVISWLRKDIYVRKQAGFLSIRTDFTLYA
ncbi:uncharacterized protein [Nicotiana sylvestris]|uniref:uncharacterized protein n=1 Tax=Nicotiana sylvestris TaxID=4096 RepID=UPI00388C754D